MSTVLIDVHSYSHMCAFNLPKSMSLDTSYMNIKCVYLCICATHFQTGEFTDMVNEDIVLLFVYERMFILSMNIYVCVLVCVQIPICVHIYNLRVDMHTWTWLSASMYRMNLKMCVGHTCVPK